MANLNVFARFASNNTVNTTNNTTDMTVKAAPQLKIADSVVKIATQLVAKIVVTKEEMKAVVTKGATVSNPKTKKGKVTRRDVKFVPTGNTVIDMQATVRARKDAFQAALDEAMGIDRTVRNCAAVKAVEVAEQAAFLLELTAHELEVKHIEEQLAKVRVAKAPRKGHIKVRTQQLKVGGPSTGALRKATARARGIALAKRNVAKAIIAKYTRTPVTPITSTYVAPVATFGTAITSLYNKVNIVCSAEEQPQTAAEVLAALQATSRAAAEAGAEGYTVPSVASGSKDSSQVNTTNGASMIKSFLTDEAIECLSETELLELVAELQEDLNEVYEGNVERACRTIITEALGADCVRSEESPSKDSSVNNRGADNLSNPSTVNQQGNTMIEAQEYTNLLATYVYKEVTVGKNLKGNLAKMAEESAAKAKAARVEFVEYFGARLIAPEGGASRTLIVHANKSGKALANADKKLIEYVMLHNVVGRDHLNNPAEVKVGSYKVPAAASDVVGQDVFSAQEFFAHDLAVATHQLSVEDKVKFVKMIAGKDVTVKATATSIVAKDVEFNFGLGTVTIGTRVQVANPFVEIQGCDFYGAHGVFLLALTAIANTNAAKLLVNNAVSLFERDENYGAKLSKVDLANGVARNFQLAVEFGVNKASKSKFPYFAIKSGKQDEDKLADILDKGQMAVVDKYNMKWMSKGVGAEAVLVGRDGDDIFNLNDASKTAKVYNRPASIKYTFADVVGRQQSHFAVALSNGQSAYSCGRKLRSVWSNSRFGHGSGVAVINPDLSFDYVVGKSLRETFNVLSLPASARAGRTARDLAEHYAAVLNEAIVAVTGKEFAPGQTILSIVHELTPHTVVRNSNKAVVVRVNGGMAVVTNDLEIEIKLNVEIVGRGEQYVKLRGIGKKATTLPYAVFGIDEEWDILLNIEAVKGYPALVEMYANSFGEDCHYYSNRGVLVTPEGEVDLKEGSNAFIDWATKSTKETVISFEMARSCYEDLKAVIEPFAVSTLAELNSLVGTGKGADVFVEDVNETTVRVHERIEYIMGDVVFDVEVSTPKEAVGTTNLTLEAANGLLLQDKALGEALLSELGNKAKGAAALVNAFTRTAELPKFDVSTVEGRNALRSAFVVAPAMRETFVNHRALLNELGKNATLRGGFAICWTAGNQEYSFEIHPQALTAFGGFSNGSATREIASVVEFLYFITDASIDGVSGIDTTISGAAFKVMSTMQYWASNLVQSANCLKKFTRSGKLVGGKVRTTYSPVVNNRLVETSEGEVVELPVVAINPRGEFAKLLRAKEGAIVGITRTPMPFCTAAILTFSTEVPDGHVWVSPKVWHAANEGDSDGDGITLMDLSRYGVDFGRAAKINESLMGPQGYHYVYGDNLPVYGFSDHGDKWGAKKSTKVWTKLDKETGKIVPTPVVTTMSVKEYGAGAALVAKHYKYNVGVSYSICSHTVFNAANLSYGNDAAKYDLAVKTCVVAWRLIYEGLGLSGYSEEASKFFSKLTFAAFSYEDGKVYVDNEGNYVMPWLVTQARSEGKTVVEVNGVHDILEQLNEGGNLTLDVASSLIKSRAICMLYRKVENKGVASINKKNPATKLLNAALTIGALRRLGQGNDPTERPDVFEENVNVHSLFELALGLNLGNNLLVAPLKEVFTAGVALHTTIAKKFQQLEAAEMFGE